jgi:hypothetical protein
MTAPTTELDNRAPGGGAGRTRLDPNDRGNGVGLGAHDHRLVLAIRHLACPRGTAATPSGSGQARAEDVLAQRFARGEIDENEYRQRLSLLREYL